MTDDHKPPTSKLDEMKQKLESFEPTNEPVNATEKSPRIFIKPEECEHIFVKQQERYFLHGRYISFWCTDCDSYVRPVWQVVKEPHLPVEKK